MASKSAGVSTGDIDPPAPASEEGGPTKDGLTNAGAFMPTQISHYPDTANNKSVSRIWAFRDGVRYYALHDTGRVRRSSLCGIKVNPAV